ncbi:MAG: hypothetical protein OXI88_11985, partial [Gammaproteobacteria bacterium]|nr:hypothetical protein [Gammaproteobacteria bacterium]MDE0512495.1 hypothetical protein [Gammaproteobacteria bacterium]
TFPFPSLKMPRRAFLEVPLNIKIRRYLTEREFTSDLTKLRAFRGRNAGNRLLESLEKDGLIKPKIRLHWPDPVARRFWLERNEKVQSLHEPVEPDGSRWDAAVRLYTSIEHASLKLKEYPHPFDNPEPEFAEFLYGPERQEFVSHLDRRASIAHDCHPILYDASNIRDYYSGWQVLAAAEVADMGIHIRANLSNPETAQNAQAAMRENRLPDGYIYKLSEPESVMNDFKIHQATLDAIVWSVEEANSALTRILGQQEVRRIRLSDEQAQNYRDHRDRAFVSGLHHYGVDKAAMIAVCQFLATRWSAWNLEGRPLIAEAYKIYLASAVRILQITCKMTFKSVRDAVGHQGNSSIPTLDVVWPDWAENQREYLVQTLQAGIMNDNSNVLSSDEIIAFAQFAKDKYQDAIFLRLEAFKRYAFTESDAPIAGMASDLQGMAVAVEHAVRTMGGTKKQLFEMFLEIWTDPPVSKLLKKHRQLATRKHPPSEWAERKSEIDSLRSKGPNEAIAADLIMAHRLRGAVHYPLGEEDQLELERLFVISLRAVAMTHAQVNKRK